MKTCSRCGETKALDDDYTKPLEVTWLCRDCHSHEHRRYPSEVEAQR